jgi:hypothetical protein
MFRDASGSEGDLATLAARNGKVPPAGVAGCLSETGQTGPSEDWLNGENSGGPRHEATADQA